MTINKKEIQEMIDLVDEFKRILENPPAEDSGGKLIKQIFLMINNLHKRLTNIESKL